MFEKILTKTSILIFLLVGVILLLFFIVLRQNAQLRSPEPIHTPTRDAITSALTITQTITATISAITSPIATLTPVTPIPPSLTPITPTLGPRSIWPPSQNFTIEEESTSQGIFLNIKSKLTDDSYRLGPIARGDYAIDPNDRYLVYMTNSGQLMAIRLGQTTFVKVKNMARQFAAVMRNIVPSFTFSFYNSGTSITLIINELHYDQTIPILLPRSVTY